MVRLTSHPTALLEHGAIDIIIDRREMRDGLHNILSMLSPQVVPGDVVEPKEAVES